MATNDGYSPYPIGLTASQSVSAINNAYNMSSILTQYSRFTTAAVPPAISTTDSHLGTVTTKEGDYWFDNVNYILYRAYIDSSSNLFWFEV
jgi:hypothetical protein